MNSMRTIDNLGTSASVRYAKDQEELDPKFLDASSLVSQKTATNVTKPYLGSEFDQRFSLSRKHTLALFQPPEKYTEQGRALFWHQIIPSLGSSEKQEADTEKLAQWAPKAPLQRKKRKTAPLPKKTNEDEEEEKERKTLLSLLECIAQLDKDLTLIQSRRNQYQRG